MSRQAIQWKPEPHCYRIIRFRSFGRKRRTIRANGTLTEAQAHCAKPEASGESIPGKPSTWWFDGYDYMAGFRPKEMGSITIRRGSLTGTTTRETKR